MRFIWLIVALLMSTSAFAGDRPLRIGIAGNSHLAALKIALDDGYKLPAGTTIAFWGFAGGVWDGVKSDNGVLRATGDMRNALAVITGDPNKTFDPKEYDVIIIYGLSMNMRTVADLVQSSRNKAMSSGMMRAAVDADLKYRFAFEYAAQIKNLEKKIIIYAAPMPSQLADRPANIAAGDEALELAADYARRVGVTFASQPQQTKADSLTTKKEYSVGVRLLRGGQRSGDSKHMNAAYGAIILDDMVRLARGD